MTSGLIVNPRSGRSNDKGVELAAHARRQARRDTSMFSKISARSTRRT